MNKINKSMLALATLSVSALSFAGSDMDSRVSELETQMKEVRSKNAASTFGTYTKTARPDVDGQNFFATFDILYWQVDMDGTAFAYTNAQGKDILPVKGRVKEIEFNKWDFGFRIGAGYNFEHGDFDLYANYTYYRNDSNLTKAGGIRGFKVSAPVVTKEDAFPSVYGTSSSQFKYNFNRVDLELGRDFFISSKLSMRPHIGLMAAWMTLDQRTRYSGEELGTNSVQISNKNDVWGVGPRGGINTQWHLCNDFSIVGNASGALTYSQFDVRREQTFSLSPETNTTKVTNSIHRMTPNAQMQLGFSYDHYTTDCKQHFSAFLAWDIQYWWNLNRSIGSTVQYPYSDNVYMQGVTLSLRVDF